LLDFFSVKELVAQTGHGVEEWPLVAPKEGWENGADECEDAGVAPVLRVRVGPDGIAVEDNGRGIPPDVVPGILDYSVRVSSREAYVAPCRGAQGNALRTLIAMPFVLSGDEGRGEAEIDARGIRHRIGVRVDRIRQEPDITHRQERSDRGGAAGTVIRVGWP